MDIQKRLVHTFLPMKKNPNFMELIEQPDAYGPFWISFTLIFIMASCSNVASYMDFVQGGVATTWSYDFSRVFTALSLVYFFFVALPAMVWALGKYMEVQMSLTTLMCLYGYSMVVFIPSSVNMTRCLKKLSHIDDSFVDDLYLSIGYLRLDYNSNGNLLVTVLSL